MSIMLKFCPHFLNLALKSTIFSVGMKQYSGQLLSEMTAQVIIYMYIYLCIYINREKEVGGHKISLLESQKNRSMAIVLQVSLLILWHRIALCVPHLSYCS